MLRVPCLLLSTAVMTGCASSATSPEAPAPPPELRKVITLPLQDYIPGAGLRWLVSLKPKEILETPGVAADWSRVFQADRVRAFAAASGTDPHLVSEVWIAGYDLGTLYVIDVKTVKNQPVDAFVARAMSSQNVESPYANLTHVTGIIEQTPHALVSVEGHMVAIAIGDIRLARIVRAYAEEKLKRSPPALQGRLLAPCASFQASAPLRAFFLGPFESATDAVTNGVVSGCSSVRSREGALEIEAQAFGVWSTDGDLANELTTWTDQVLSTRELRALGWGFPQIAPTVTCDNPNADTGLTRCQASGTWSSKEIAAALYRVTAASMAEIVETAPENWHPEATTRTAPKSAQEPAANDETRKSPAPSTGVAPR